MVVIKLPVTGLPQQMRSASQFCAQELVAPAAAIEIPRLPSSGIERIHDQVLVGIQRERTRDLEVEVVAEAVHLTGELFDHAGVPQTDVDRLKLLVPGNLAGIPASVPAPAAGR